jgi:hypothetical protein
MITRIFWEGTVEGEGDAEATYRAFVDRVSIEIEGRKCLVTSFQLEGPRYLNRWRATVEEVRK